MVPRQVAVEFELASSSANLYSHTFVQFLFARCCLFEFLVVSLFSRGFDVARNRLLYVLLLLVLCLFHLGEISSFLIPLPLIEAEISAEWFKRLVSQDNEFLSDCVAKVSIVSGDE